MPAYNAEKTLERTISDIPSGSVDEVILVDDCSRDGTVALARKLGLTVICHEANKGYGGNQKTCYAEALKRGADVVVMVHPDYQYDARLVPIMAALITNDICDMVCGNRIRTRWEALNGGMPVYKYVFNRLLTMFENGVTGQNMGEWHSGLRAYSRKCLETLPWEKNSDDFVFDQQFLIQAAMLKQRLGDVPVAARYFAEASSINFRRSCVYGLTAMYYLALSVVQRLGLARFDLFEPKQAR
ncbi:MAG: glycosyl transferase family 2 [Elusimicrobia bacterium RIFOXYD12_FULL_66_9]|nr:MAG: glycosyl transferase family 2 [Elusimicrobia bacterium RIFOXYD12_FULL_66_9]